MQSASNVTERSTTRTGNKIDHPVRQPPLASHYRPDEGVRWPVFHNRCVTSAIQERLLAGEQLKVKMKVLKETSKDTVVCRLLERPVSVSVCAIREVHSRRKHDTLQGPTGISPVSASKANEGISWRKVTLATCPSSRCTPVRHLEDRNVV